MELEELKARGGDGNVVLRLPSTEIESRAQKYIKQLESRVFPLTLPPSGLLLA